MTALQVGVVVSAVLLASFVQSIAGFGFGLLSVPVMTLAVSPPRAVIISALVGALATTWQAVQLRADADRAVARRMTAAAVLGMPLGLVVLNTVSDDALRILLGSAVLVAVATLIIGVVIRGSRTLDAVAGFMSGVLNTSLSTNGPPLVFALQARRMEPAQFRATISTVFALSNVVALTLFLIDGRITGEALRATALALPALVGGQLLGTPLRRHVHGARFRHLVLVLLAVAGASAIAAALR